MNSTLKHLAAAHALAALCLAGAACGQQAATSATTPESAEVAQLANPWSEVEDVEEAAKIAGFDAPNITEGYEVADIRAMDDMIEMDVTKDGQTYTLRKSEGAGEDISGDSNEYSTTTVTITGRTVEMRLDENGDIMVATWSDDDNSYSLAAEDGTNRDVVAYLVDGTLH